MERHTLPYPQLLNYTVLCTYELDKPWVWRSNKFTLFSWGVNIFQYTFTCKIICYYLTSYISLFASYTNTMWRYLEYVLHYWRYLWYRIGESWIIDRIFCHLLECFMGANTREWSWLPQILQFYRLLIWEKQTNFYVPKFCQFQVITLWSHDTMSFM